MYHIIVDATSALLFSVTTVIWISMLAASLTLNILSVLIHLINLIRHEILLKKYIF